MKKDFQTDIFGGKVEIMREEEERDEIKASAKPAFNIFALTDVIAARDKKEAWIQYERALASGLAADQIFWNIAWGVKSLLLAEKTKTAAEAGLNPFVFSKSKAALKNFKEGEVEQLSETLVVGYHDVRRGLEEMETFLEKLILGL